MTIEKVTSTTLAFTENGVLLRYYYAFRNATPDSIVTSIQLSFPFRIEGAKARDKNGEISVSPSKVISPHTPITISLRHPVSFGQKYAFTLSALFSPEEGFGRWKNTFVMDWGKENLDEIIFIKTRPLFVSGIGKWEKQGESFILTPARGWKSLIGHSRKGKTIRFEWGDPPKFHLMEEFTLRSPNSLENVRVKFFIPKETENHYSRIISGKCDVVLDPSKNLEATAVMDQVDDNTWKYRIIYEVIQKPRKPVPETFGRLSTVVQVGKKYPDLIRETDLLDFSDPGIKTISSSIRKTSDDLKAVLKLAFEFVNQKVQYMENGERWCASRVLKDRRGDCSEFSDLFISILRGMGIPAFGVLGYVVDLREKNVSYHEWAKVLTGEGWLPFDPTWGYFGSVGISHIEVAHEIHGHETWYSGFKALGDLSNAQTKTQVSLVNDL
ncbi:MAG: hypothetical protein D6732_18720 [Methanobacteriota archaeon]|nr:MAG: hypothetical protein D6732_18720 [Euryarchaeota archaeon]